jgi:hypothetical protein
MFALDQVGCEPNKDAVEVTYGSIVHYYVLVPDDFQIATKYIFADLR